jgi:hypothetical protein
MADEKTTVTLVHKDKGAALNVAGTKYAADKKTGLVEVAPEHVGDALSHGFEVPKAEEKSK